MLDRFCDEASVKHLQLRPSDFSGVRIFELKREKGRLLRTLKVKT